MKKSMPIAETLAGMYHTDIPFLEGNKVPVIKRKFNWIPTGEKGDPPRALTDQPPLKTYFYEQHAVSSDFPKTMAYRMYGDGFKQFPDGTYHDAVLGLEDDYLERQKALKQVFAPSDVYQFMRADREQYLQEMMKDYFRSKYEEREEAEEMFLTNYGLAPHEVKTVMAQRRVEMAAKALQQAKTSNKIATHPMGYNLRRDDFIPTRFMDNSIPLMSADDVRGVGNAQPWAKGHEPWTRGFGEESPYAHKTPGAKSRDERRGERVAEIMQKMKGEKTASVTNEIVSPAERVNEALKTLAETTGGFRDLRDMPKQEEEAYAARINTLTTTNAPKEQKARLMDEITKKYKTTDALVRKKFGLGAKWGGGKKSLSTQGGGAGK